MPGKVPGDAPWPPLAHSYSSSRTPSSQSTPQGHVVHGCPGLGRCVRRLAPHAIADQRDIALLRRFSKLGASGARRLGGRELRRQGRLLERSGIQWALEALSLLVTWCPVA